MKSKARTLLGHARTLAMGGSFAQTRREVAMLQSTVKALGYQLAKKIADTNLAESREPIAAPVRIGLGSKCTTQQDMESRWLWYWCQQYQIPVIYHRKIWELSYILQVMWENDLLQPGKRGLGFGCGQEPIPSLVANYGVELVVTDQDASTAEKDGWISSDQHLGSLEQAFHGDLVDRATFDRLVTIRFVDMNAIDTSLRDFDFCWSTCAFEHLGSIKAGQDFVVNAMRVLKPGGIAIHTTEININAEGPTLEAPDVVIFQRKHFEEIGERLRAQGDIPAPMNFDFGTGPIDEFIDVPPYSSVLWSDLSAARGEDYPERLAHLRLSVGEYPTTCFGLWARRGSGTA